MSYCDLLNDTDDSFVIVAELFKHRGFHVYLNIRKGSSGILLL